MEMACRHCDVFNDLDHWPSEKFEEDTLEIECPNCGAHHHMWRGKFSGELHVELFPDNG